MFKLLLLVLSVMALLLTFRTNSRTTNVITGALLLAVILVQFNNEGWVLSGIILYEAVVAVALGYGILMKQKKWPERIVLTGLPAVMFTYWLWRLNHWHGNTALMPLLALCTGVFGLFRVKNLKSEWGYLLILFVDALVSAIENMM